MKKSIYLPLGIAVLVLLGTGCTAEDPANGLDINQTIFADGDGSSSGSTENPMTRYKISSYNFGSASYNFDYTTSGSPIGCEVADRDNYSYAAVYDFDYIAGSDYPSSVSWEYGKIYRVNWEEYTIYTEEKIENLQFEGGLLKSLIYSGIKITYKDSDGTVEDKETLPGHNVQFEYDDADHLVKILVDDTPYTMTWDAAGNLTEINSPYFGSSKIEYTDITNRYGQWDPTLPMMGFFQTYGWFGTAPAHFPSKIQTASSLFDENSGSGSRSRAGTVAWYDLDYSLNYEGLIDNVKWSQSLNNYKEVRINYLQVQ